METQIDGLYRVLAAKVERAARMPNGNAIRYMIAEAKSLAMYARINDFGEAARAYDGFTRDLNALLKAMEVA